MQLLYLSHCDAICIDQYVRRSRIGFNKLPNVVDVGSHVRVKIRLIVIAEEAAGPVNPQLFVPNEK